MVALGVAEAMAVVALVQTALEALEALAGMEETPTAKAQVHRYKNAYC
jgi:hypothetical protein